MILQAIDGRALLLAAALFAAVAYLIADWRARNKPRAWWLDELDRQDAERARRNADIDKAVRDWEAS